MSTPKKDKNNKEVDKTDVKTPVKVRRKKKICAFCVDKVERIDYKDWPS